MFVLITENLNLADLLKCGLEIPVLSKKITFMSTNHHEEEKKISALSILLPLLLLGLLAAGAYYLLGTGPKVAAHGAAHGEAAHAGTASHDHDTTSAHHEAGHETAMPAAGSMKVKLPNGTELNAYKGGIEEKLVAFLGTDYKALGADSLKTIWFDFDHLNFKTNSAEITPESKQQIDNLAAICKAFPAAKLKIGGYTDKTGSEPANKKLSGDRAAAVKAALTTAGVGAQVTEAEGYGSAMAKHPADAPESEREKDRRVSVSVRL